MALRQSQTPHHFRSFLMHNHLWWLLCWLIGPVILAAEYVSERQTNKQTKFLHVRVFSIPCFYLFLCRGIEKQIINW